MATDPFSDEQESAGGGFDPVALLRVFWRRKTLFLVPFGICSAMAVTMIKTMTPIYESSGEIELKLEGLNSNLLTDPSRRFGRARNIDAMAFHEMNMLLTSPDFLELMVRELNLAHRNASVARPEHPVGGSSANQAAEQSGIDRARNKLAARLELKRGGARLFELSVRDPRAETAYRTVHHIINRFVDEYRLSQMASGNSTREFLREQLERYQVGLQASEELLNAYVAEIASESLDTNPITSINLTTARVNIEAAEERYQGTDAREWASLGQSMRRILGSIPDLQSYRRDDLIQATWNEMETVGKELLLYPAASSRAQEVEQRLGQLRVRLNTRVEAVVAVKYPALSGQNRNQIASFVYFSLFREGVRSVLDGLTGDIRDFRAFTIRQPEQSSRLGELERDVESARGLVSKIETEITQQTMNLDASRSELGMQIKVRRQPRLSGAPVEPDKVKLTLLGVMLSLGIGLGLVMLAIFLDKSFSSVTDIERTLGLDVIGTLPAIKDIHFERRRKVRILRWLTIILGILAVGAVGFLVVYPRLG